jgi:hypothetical protein
MNNASGSLKSQGTGSIGIFLKIVFKLLDPRLRWWITGRDVDNDVEGDVKHTGDARWMMLNKSSHSHHHLPKLPGQVTSKPAYGKNRTGPPILSDDWSSYSPKVKKLQEKIRKRRETLALKAQHAQMQVSAGRTRQAWG